MLMLSLPLTLTFALIIAKGQNSTATLAHRQTDWLTLIETLAEKALRLADRITPF